MPIQPNQNNFPQNEENNKIFVLGTLQNISLMGMGYRQHFGKKHAKQKIQ
ncbi:hypothetical protein ABES36_28400 [Bacillus pseudomycoides]|nr:hypothetical protein [Bacillus pseudomycoides]